MTKEQSFAIHAVIDSDSWPGLYWNNLLYNISSVVPINLKIFI
jgi:hypothetical protein